MAQNVTIAGAAFSAVPAIEVPKTGGGIATFADPSGTTATASDVAQGKLFLSAAGVLTTGTASGGGGSSWTLRASYERYNLSWTGTTATTWLTVSTSSEVYTKNNIVWVHIRDDAGPRNGYFYGTDSFIVNYRAGNDTTTTFQSASVYTLRYNNDAYTGYVGQYGAYGYSLDSGGGLTLRKRYNSTYSLTIDGYYNIDVYTLALPDGLFLFE